MATSSITHNFVISNPRNLSFNVKEEKTNS